MMISAALSENRKLYVCKVWTFRPEEKLCSVEAVKIFNICYNKTRGRTNDYFLEQLQLFEAFHLKVNNHMEPSHSQVYFDRKTLEC